MLRITEQTAAATTMTKGANPSGADRRRGYQQLRIRYLVLPMLNAAITRITGSRNISDGCGTRSGAATCRNNGYVLSSMRTLEPLLTLLVFLVPTLHANVSGWTHNKTRTNPPGLSKECVLAEISKQKVTSG